MLILGKEGTTMINKLRLTIKSPKTLIAATLFSIFSSTVVYANDSCNADLEAGLTINKSKIEFFESKNKTNVLYRIDSQNNLIVGGKSIALNTEQTVLIKQYSARIQAIVPKVRSVATESIELALEGVNLTFNELLGEGNKVSADLTKELSSIRDEVLNKFTIENGITIGEDGLEDEKLLGKEFEQRIESAVEKAVVSSMGTLLVTLGQEIMFSGGDTNTLEERMESFGDNIEREMETRSKTIEQKADSLCFAIIEIDQLEEQLKSSIAPLADINVLTVKRINVNEAKDKRLM